MTYMIKREVSAAAALLGSKGGKARSESKSVAAVNNGQLGGRPIDWGKRGRRHGRVDGEGAGACSESDPGLRESALDSLRVNYGADVGADERDEYVAGYRTGFVAAANEDD